jgi:antitoxin FitA
MWGQPPSAVRRAKLDLLFPVAANRRAALVRHPRVAVATQILASPGIRWSFTINDSNDIIDGMASITIRKLEETTKRKLKIRAAMHGRSMEQEAREILNNALRQKPSSLKTGADLAEAIRRRFAPFGGVELEPLPRTPIRDPDIR